jgi:hypothetical protein
VAEVADDPNPWVYGFDYGQLMLREWFPARRHGWFDVPCCPPNLARMFAGVAGHVAEIDHSGDLCIHLPIACRIRADGWDVAVDGDYPEGGRIAITVHEAPPGCRVRVRRPGWAGGGGHQEPPGDGVIALPVAWQWWTTDQRVEGAAGTVHLRRGPVVYCAEGVDHAGLDLRELAVDPTQPPERAFVRRPPAGRGLHHPAAPPPPCGESVRVTMRPYSDWANRGTTTMRLRFPTIGPRP